jgi:hypothetical protein
MIAKGTFNLKRNERTHGTPDSPMAKSLGDESACGVFY